MTRFRLLLVAAALAAGFGCDVGGPPRAGDIQNVNAIADDISAVTMTQSERLRATDPNVPTTFPNHYQVVKEDQQ
jgi:hypothetical protein